MNRSKKIGWPCHAMHKFMQHRNNPNANQISCLKQQEEKKFTTNHQAEKHSSFGVNLCRNWYQWAYLFVGASIAWNEEDRDTQELDEMQLVVNLLPTLMIETKAVFLFGGGGGGGGSSSGGSQDWSIGRVHICHVASIQQGLVQLIAARKTKP